MAENQQNTSNLLTTSEPEIKSSRIKERMEMIKHIRTEGYGLEQEKEFVLSMYEDFLQAVQNGEKKIHLLRITTEPTDLELDMLPRWDEESDFAEWVNEARRLLVELRIPEIKEKLSQKYSEFNPSPFQLQMLNLEGDLKLEDPLELEKLDKEWYEFVDWKLAHDKETCDKFLSGKIQLTEKELIADMLDREIGKIALATVDKMGRRLNMGGKPMPHITEVNEKEGLPARLKELDKKSKEGKFAKPHYGEKTDDGYIIHKN